MLSLPEGGLPASQLVKTSFSIADYAVFAGMLCISTSIGVYYAWTVSVSSLMQVESSLATLRSIEREKPLRSERRTFLLFRHTFANEPLFEFKVTLKVLVLMVFLQWGFSHFRDELPDLTSHGVKCYDCFYALQQHVTISDN